MQIRTSLQWQNHVPFNLMPRPAVDPWLSKTKRFRWAYPELRYSMPHAIPKKKHWLQARRRSAACNADKDDEHAVSICATAALGRSSDCSDANGRAPGSNAQHSVRRNSGKSKDAKTVTLFHICPKHQHLEAKTSFNQTL